MILKLAEDYKRHIEAKIINKQTFINTAMNLFKDLANVLNDPEIKRVITK